MEKERQRIKVLYTIPNFDTAGSGKALLNIATRLAADKFEPHIMCMHDRGDLFREVMNSGIPVHLLEYTTPMKPYWKGLYRCWKISRAIRSIGPDVIHSFHYSADYSEGIAARLAGTKWVYTKKNMSWGGSSRNAWKLRSALAHGIIAQNKDMLRDFFPGEKKVTLIPRGVDAHRFAPGPHLPSFQQQFGVRPGERIVISVANLVPVKGIEILIQAFAQLAKDFPQWKVWVVGDDRGDYGNQLKALVKERWLADRVLFAGKQPEVKTFLDQAEVFVLPTLNTGRMEGSPVSLLEAMANGKVVIGSNIPGIKDQLKDFSEFLFEAGRADHLEKLLRSILARTTDELELTGKLFSNSVEQKFSIDREVLEHSSFYEQVVNRRIMG